MFSNESESLYPELPGNQIMGLWEAI
jgi:hypothetical protein